MNYRLCIPKNIVADVYPGTQPIRILSSLAEPCRIQFLYLSICMAKAVLPQRRAPQG